MRRSLTVVELIPQRFAQDGVVIPLVLLVLLPIILCLGQISRLVTHIVHYVRLVLGFFVLTVQDEAVRRLVHDQLRSWLIHLVAVL